MTPPTPVPVDRENVIDCLREYSDKVDEVEITDFTDLEFDLGLDSFCGIELACEFSARLGVSIPKKVNPLKVKDEETGHRRFRRFGELVEYLATLPAETRN